MRKMSASVEFTGCRKQKMAHERVQVGNDLHRSLYRPNRQSAGMRKIGRGSDSNAARLSADSRHQHLATLKAVIKPKPPIHVQSVGRFGPMLYAAVTTGLSR